MMNVNPMQLLQMIKGGQNPQQLVMSLLQNQMGNTPMGQQLMSLLQNDDQSGLETIARNLCAQKGIDFDKEFSSFKKQMNLK